MPMPGSAVADSLKGDNEGAYVDLLMEGAQMRQPDLGA